MRSLPSRPVDRTQPEAPGEGVDKVDLEVPVFLVARPAA
jgi:hypothetical protein